MKDYFLNTNIANIFYYLSLAIASYTNVPVIYLTSHSKANICPSLCALVQTSDPKVAVLMQTFLLSKCSTQTGFCERLLSKLFYTNQRVAHRSHLKSITAFCTFYSISPLDAFLGQEKWTSAFYYFRGQGCLIGMSHSALNFPEHTHKTDVDFH